MWLFNKIAKNEAKSNSDSTQVSFTRKKYRRRLHHYTVEEKIALIKEYEKNPTSLNSFRRMYGVCNDTFAEWLKRYKAEGEAGLAPRNRGKKRIIIEPAIKDEILRLKKSNPAMGSGKISDWLMRNKFVSINKQKVMEILNDDPETVLLIAEQHKKRARNHPSIQRFERSRPRQMYQMDIMTWMLRGLYRVYVITCLDDYSRFVVSFGIFRRARTGEAVDVLRAAIEQYGMPEEVLTDNGPQFYTWRGRSEFQRYLVKSGIHSLRSRPRHPQTLGKVESFWRNLYQEMLSRTPIATFEELQVKVQEWVKYYNYHRPHQGIENLVPADRFFGIEKPIKEAMEQGAAIVKDGLMVDPKKLTEPMYLVGRIGGKEIKVIAKEGTVVVSGLDEVEKKNSPEASTGVKLDLTRENGTIPEVKDDRTGTKQVSAAYERQGKNTGTDGCMVKEENSAASVPGAAGEQGSVLPVGTESHEQDGSIPGKHGPGPQTEGSCGGQSVAK